MQTNTIGIVSAMAEELAALQAQLEHSHTVTLAGRQFHWGQLGGQSVCLVLCGIGKVAAASTATLLLGHFGVAGIVFTGVAGGLAEQVNIGDVVVANALLQHDMNAEPLFPRWEIPLTGIGRFVADAHWHQALWAATTHVLAEQPVRTLAGRSLSARAYAGLVISGDQFVASAHASSALRCDLPDALAVEMEGAALAQVCHDWGKPCAVLRTISDRADDDAAVDFPLFLREVAAVYARDIVLRFLWREAPKLVGNQG
ncbi:5'-methylthioadenosine/adenosylhomocysteine nucleosidase [Curvibacter sp. CHRR-16]|uniref:5'-methylthioadenosine/adenosylhomocysteine nucleosidase n=1 Tax=Curvibacter sp. CHRR-16 TaxID=2835872 RepID=UPI001BDA0051|nr:5'-methylthioadenosine/adenosylhomocysteine nucleosidase [Curvibacter sp. CHRR-16]MBT0570452.1 5'-methylthioadenosine/adenosylhomocysteine nucleosidase [Curvibacter sp. CHRR-16]